jgi:membrane-associated phospholipid phosphatase
MANLLHLDQWLFDVVNQGMDNALFDAILPFFREKLFWCPFYLFILAFIGFNYSRSKAGILLLGLILAVGLADFTSSNLVKKNVQRIRPCNDPIFSQHIEKRVACGAGFSFTSSHASNHFAVSVFLITIFGQYKRWIKPVLLFWAALIAFSQVYVGVHYPFDVLGGAIIGISLGYFVGRLCIFAMSKIPEKTN